MITAIFCICCFWSLYTTIWSFSVCKKFYHISITVSSSISILSIANLGAVVNNLATLLLIFSRLIYGSDSADSLICSVSVVFRLFTDRYFPFLLLRILSFVSSKFSTSLLRLLSVFRLVLLRSHF
jgi:hypothetical protein